ncbi:MAG: PDZ domain-containing protein, partial [Candidatus Eremiobacteraeota bacterium]|nr:PDZ domain-containing protein [Candidatus Eremiobacteraeota bacterium]
PLQLQHSVTVGVVSGFNREEPIRDENGGYIDFKGLLQTSAPINPGNSGGPLVDVDGRVIGVNQSTAAPTTAQGIGFAIPANIVRTQVGSLEQNPGVHQGTNVGFIGAQLTSLNSSVRQQIGYNGGQSGVVVAQVLSGTPADRAGLQPGDIILRANGQAVTDPQRLINMIRTTKPGQQLSLEVWSRGVKRLASLSVSERPADYYQPTQQQP